MSKTVHLLAIFAFIVVSALGFPGIVSSGEQAQVQTKERERARPAQPARPGKPDKPGKPQQPVAPGGPEAIKPIAPGGPEASQPIAPAPKPEPR